MCRVKNELSYIKQEGLYLSYPSLRVSVICEKKSAFHISRDSVLFMNERTSSFALLLYICSSKYLITAFGGANQGFFYRKLLQQAHIKNCMGYEGWHYSTWTYAPRANSKTSAGISYSSSKSNEIGHSPS